MAISSHKRRKIADFDPVRDGKTITQFCKEEQISRQTFHNVKNRIAKRGWDDILQDSGTLKDRQAPTGAQCFKPAPRRSTVGTEW